MARIFPQNKHVHVHECKTYICIVIWTFVLISNHLYHNELGYSRFAYSRFAYSHFIYSHFAYSHFAYSQMLSLSRFAYTQYFCKSSSLKGILIKPVQLLKLLLMVDYYWKLSLYCMYKYDKKTKTIQIDKILGQLLTVIVLFCIDHL